MATLQQQHWKEAALARSEGITDAWEITKVYAGRLAEWVLFACMVTNIIEILPGVAMWPWLVNTILGVQAVTLDIAGFGLATMAEQARINGQTDVAHSAKRTAYLLIALMMVTVLSISIGTLWPSVKGYTDIADKLLILVRVAMTVWYGHVLHDLRAHSSPMVPTPVIEEQLLHLAERMADLQRRQESHLHTILCEVEHRIASIRQPEPINYVELAERIVPLLPQPVAPNLSKVEEQIALLVQQVRATENVTQDATEPDTESATQPDPLSATGDATEPVTSIRLLRTQKRYSPATGKDADKAAKAKRYIRRDPEIDAATLAQKAQISASYARRLLAEHRTQLA